MSRDVPFFSARAINTVKDFTRFYHVLDYMIQRSEIYQGVPADRMLMDACGFKNFAKWRRRRPEYDSLHRGIPLPYLEAIGARLDVLMAAAEADLVEFRAVLALPLSPRWAIERVFPAIYRDIELPKGLSEEAAIELLRTHAQKTGNECCLNFFQIKAIYIKPNGAAHTIIFEPTIHVSSGFLIAKADGRSIGTCTM